MKYSWPADLIYESFSFYIMSSITSRCNPKINYIYYYCSNHRKNSLFYKETKICNSKNSYNKLEKNFI